ncbi:hypothetical protein NHX12_023880 [Muraenolepis orangiensis]|uniref:Uncharacterized protein n=1 Tax=Muraenolepis orangiensis TaxID=630683 RepID=A0A9Q0IQJ0_9TELE|nr:hypothetical protein NHX12_023880 [Muraenolepis orangiensis]
MGGRDGPTIPASDLIGPLTTALDPPPVRRYMVFNSSLFHFVMAPVLYVVIWCGVFSTANRYMTITDYWMNVNVDVRLIQVNETLIKHKLLVGVADWVHNCSGTLQLFFIYWDMSSCMRTLTQALDRRLIAPDELQKRLTKRLSHLLLRVDVSADGQPSAVQRPDEERPLLAEEEMTRSTVTSQRGDTKLTANHNLLPDPGLPAQDTAYQLLVTYSSVYTRLLVSKRLSAPPTALHQDPHQDPYQDPHQDPHQDLHLEPHQDPHQDLHLDPHQDPHQDPHPRPGSNHCSTGPLCLCQYIRAKVL